MENELPLAGKSEIEQLHIQYLKNSEKPIMPSRYSK